MRKLQISTLIAAALIVIVFQACGSSTGPDNTLVYQGKTYHTTVIDGRTWIRENLNVGTMISADAASSNNSIIEKYCYNNDTANCVLYGGLYKWDEAMQYVTAPEAKGICPEGWHIPSLAEYSSLLFSIGADGNALKATGQGSGDGAGSNSTAFTGLLAGYLNTSGKFAGFNSTTNFWSSSLSLNDNSTANVLILNSTTMPAVLSLINKGTAVSVRCIKDE